MRSVYLTYTPLGRNAFSRGRKSR